MNIAFFLLPKQVVVTITQDATLRQTLERMEYHRYTAVPIIGPKGTYEGTVTEGDLLWFMKNQDLSFSQTNKVQLAAVPLRMQNKAVSINSNMEDLIILSKSQNFVPVVDDMNRFIGIVRRSDIIDYCEKALFREIAVSNNQEDSLSG